MQFVHPLDGSKIKGLRGCKKEEHNASMSLIRRPSAAISKHIEETSIIFAEKNELIKAVTMGIQVYKIKHTIVTKQNKM
jgi:hypothetical protein